MADGTVTTDIGGKSYDLQLSFRAIARLQAKHGRNVAGLLDGTAGDIPDMAAVLDVLSEAIQRGSGVEASVADDLADELMSANSAILGPVLLTAFPDAPGGNGKAAGKHKA